MWCQQSRCPDNHLQGINVQITENGDSLVTSSQPAAKEMVFTVGCGLGMTASTACSGIHILCRKSHDSQVTCGTTPPKGKLHDSLLDLLLWELAGKTKVQLSRLAYQVNFTSWACIAWYSVYIYVCPYIIYTCTSVLWLVTISLIWRTSEQVTPPTTNSRRRGWLPGRGRAELINKLEREIEREMERDQWEESRNDVMSIVECVWVRSVVQCSIESVVTWILIWVCLWNHESGSPGQRDLVERGEIWHPQPGGGRAGRRKERERERKGGLDALSSVSWEIYQAVYSLVLARSGRMMDHGCVICTCVCPGRTDENYF